MGDNLDSSESACTREHCLYAFDTLYVALTSGAECIEPEFPDDKYPLFVTWNTRSSRPDGQPRLRGCIGNFEPQSLHGGLAEYALVSAFKDARFRKVERRELERLECAISLLTDFEDAASYLDWDIGVHGIYIKFPHPSLLQSSSSPPSGSPSPLSSSTYLPSLRFSSKKSFTACYLPDVAPDQGWTKVETIDSAIRKAGWDGPITEDLRRGIKLRRYQSSQCRVGWAEYWEWRQEQEKLLLG